jgi:pimeloyl-ACP methyl ester carboxylesterase
VHRLPRQRRPGLALAGFIAALALGLVPFATAAPDPSRGGSGPAAAMTPLERHFLATLPPVAETAKSALPKHTKHGVHLFECKATPGGLCGRLKVPLDRTHHVPGHVRLFFQYYRHTGKGPAHEAIMLSEGGPGYSVTETQFESPFYLQTFTPLMKHRDLIMLDQRGVGRSEAINCKGLQHHNDFGSPQILQLVEDCGDQLGPAASFYGSGDVALDMEAVRRALHISKLDLYGGSAAGQDVQSYATRFPEHVRSAVLDSPLSVTIFGSPGAPLNTFATDLAHAGPRVAGLLCDRSASCSDASSDPEGDIAWLAQELRANPVDGTGYDADGKPHSLHVTEGVLGWSILQSDAGGYVAPSEVVGAALALQDGDEAPLLRLAAETDGGGGDSGPAKIFSDGDNLARQCTDFRYVWQKSASVPERMQQWQDARDALPADEFGDFSVDGWLTRPPAPAAPDPCIEWPKPAKHTLPAVPRHAEFPGSVPALVITGDLDLVLPPEDSKPLTKLWPHSRYVEIQGSGHHTFFQAMACSDPIIVHFIKDLNPGNTKCAKTFPDKNDVPAVGNFPVHATDAAEATVEGSGDQSTATDRRVATVTAATVTDAFRHAFVQSQPGPGPGLRGGTFAPTFGQAGLKMELGGDRFAQDVAVSGTAHYSFSSQAFKNTTVTVDGPGSEDGTLAVSGVWFGFGLRTTVLKVTGTLGGRTISVTVPAT